MGKIEKWHRRLRQAWVCFETGFYRILYPLRCLPRFWRVEYVVCENGLTGDTVVLPLTQLREMEGIIISSVGITREEIVTTLRQWQGHYTSTPFFVNGTYRQVIVIGNDY